MTDTDKERLAFEKWCYLSISDDLRKDDDGSYISFDTDSAWFIWQAAWQARARDSRCGELVGVSEKLDFAVRKLYPVRYVEPELYQAVLNSSFAVTELAPALRELLDALDNCVELSAPISPRSRKAIAAFEAKHRTPYPTHKELL